MLFGCKCDYRKVATTAATSVATTAATSVATTAAPGPSVTQHALQANKRILLKHSLVGQLAQAVARGLGVELWGRVVFNPMLNTLNVIQVL